MESSFGGGIDLGTQEAILSQFDLPTVRGTEQGGGTANPKNVLITDDGRFLLRRRRPEFSVPDIVVYDHSLLLHLRAQGLPLPELVPTTEGATWVEHEGAIYELHRWIECEAFRQENLEQVAAVAQTLGQMHGAVHGFTPRGSKEWPREDHPDLLLSQLTPHLQRASGEDRRIAELIRDELRQLLTELPDVEYERLPHLVVHGDYHPGNVKFRGDEVVGLFDFDWANRQARVLDVVDGLYCFAFRRPADMDPDDVWSLTQPAEPSVEFSRVFLGAYGQHVTLTDDEERALPLLLRSRLCQMRIRGARKVPDEEKLRFLTWGIADQLRWVREEWDSFWAEVTR